MAIIIHSSSMRKKDGNARAGPLTFVNQKVKIHAKEIGSL